MKLWSSIARVLRRVTSRKGSPAFLGTLVHSVTCMVTTTLRGEPLAIRNGGRGAEVMVRAAYGWETRVTVMGGPDWVVISTPKLKLLTGAFAGWLAVPR